MQGGEEVTVTCFPQHMLKLRETQQMEGAINSLSGFLRLKLSGPTYA